MNTAIRTKATARHLLALAALIALAQACARLPDKPPVAPTFVLPPISAASEAMHWRLALIDSAEVSVDIQYFTWNSDASGDLPLRHLLGLDTDLPTQFITFVYACILRALTAPLSMKKRITFNRVTANRLP